MKYEFKREKHDTHTLIAPYDLLVKAFGDDGLTAARDDYKSMATWDLFPGPDFVEVYDYKVGTCYSREDGQKLADITEWHVQGADAGFDRMLVLLERALAPTPWTVTVEVDASMHPRSPESEEEALVWAVLDTAHNLLRDAAVTLTLLGIRKVADEEGVPFPDDEELFAGSSATRRDLAVHSALVVNTLSSAFRFLVKKTGEEAVAALGRIADEEELSRAQFDADFEEDPE